MDLGIIWKVADTFNALMCIPNMIALALLSPVLTKLVLEKYPLKKK